MAPKKGAGDRGAEELSQKQRRAIMEQRRLEREAFEENASAQAAARAGSTSAPRGAKRKTSNAALGTTGRARVEKNTKTPRGGRRGRGRGTGAASDRGAKRVSKATETAKGTAKKVTLKRPGKPPAKSQPAAKSQPEHQAESELSDPPSNISDNSQNGARKDAPNGAPAEQETSKPFQRLRLNGPKPPGLRVKVKVNIQSSKSEEQVSNDLSQSDEQRKSLKRKRGPIKEWRRLMHWPGEISGRDEWERNQGQNAPGFGPVLPLQLKQLQMLPRVSGMEGPVSDFPSDPGDESESNLVREIAGNQLGDPIARHRRDAVYDDDECVDHLGSGDCYLENHPESIKAGGPDDGEKKAYGNLFTADCKLPDGTVFEDDAYKHFCQAVKEKNEAFMIQLIGDLIVPQGDLAIRRMQGFKTDRLKDSICEVWSRSIPLNDQSARLGYRYVLKLTSSGLALPLPQPDHTVGFSSAAFTEKQVNKLTGHLSDKDEYDERGYAEVMKDVFFPFLTAEVKCRMSDMKQAERQNAHNMAVAMRGIVELFKRVDPQKVKELHRKVLGFSISQNREKVHIHAHYVVVDGRPDPRNNEQLLVTYHTFRVRNIKWTNEASKWTAYKFVMAVYKDWMPRHLQRLRAAIDGLADPRRIEKKVPAPASGWGTDEPAVNDPNVPNIDFKMLKDRQDDHQEALRQAGLSETPEGSDVPSVHETYE